MNTQEATYQENRIAKFRALQARLETVNELMNTLTAPDPGGPCQQNPFTGNTRESRSVVCIQIEFSKTKGGAAPVTLGLNSLDISANDFGDYLKQGLRAERASLEKTMKLL